MKTYIITGGAGFIGSALAKRLVKDKNKVYILDDLSTGFEENIPSGIRFYKVDISDMRQLKKIKLPATIDVIYHIAAQPSAEASFDDPCRDIEVNYKAAYNMLLLCQRLQCKRFLYSSSMGVYGDISNTQDGISETYFCDPMSYYGIHKLASEKIIRIFSKTNNIDYTIFRLFNVFGPGQNMSNMKQGMVSIYFSYIMKDIPIHVKGSLDRFRDFIYIDDVIDAFIAAENSVSANGEIFNVGRGVKTTVRELLENITLLYGKNDFTKWVKILGSTAGDVKGFVADISKIKERLGWKPKYALPEGLIAMKQWLDNNVSV